MWLQVAQKLYEGINLSSEEATGLITYIRTDGFHVGVILPFLYDQISIV
jgi:DNA topoisomerase IA